MNLLQDNLCYALLAADSDLSISEKLPKALMNTVLGMGTVFVILICISIIIYLIKFIPSIVNMFAKKDNTVNTTLNPTNANHPTNSPVTRVNETIENLANDHELVAVITAAIMASLGDAAPADGLIVRSIRKKSR